MSVIVLIKSLWEVLGLGFVFQLTNTLKLRHVHQVISVEYQTYIQNEVTRIKQLI